MSDLVKKLRRVRFAGTHKAVPGMCHAAADEIERLTTERGDLIEAARELVDNWTHYATGQAMVHKSRLKKLAVALDAVSDIQEDGGD